MLKATGLRNVMSRQDWPIEVLRRVFAELQSEVPRSLLERELWCASADSAEWWAKSRTYSRSLAVTSMIGYVLGLGDRHLDNMLIDMRSGELLHIDYNVCFDKGARLRVPELVPFRLTSTLRGALGISGVQGPFQVACELSMEVMRQHRELLLTLLETFVYDPLVDWTKNEEDDKARAEIELAVSLSLFASRVDEMEGPLQTNQVGVTTARQIDASI